MMFVNRIKNYTSRTFSKCFNQFVLKHFGLVAAPLNYQINIENAIQHFVNVHEVSTIFDIGSFDGCWTRDIGKRFFLMLNFTFSRQINGTFLMNLVSLREVSIFCYPTVKAKEIFSRLAVPETQCIKRIVSGMSRLTQ